MYLAPASACSHATSGHGATNESCEALPPHALRESYLPAFPFERDRLAGARQDAAAALRGAKDGEVPVAYRAYREPVGRRHTVDAEVRLAFGGFARRDEEVGFDGGWQPPDCGTPLPPYSSFHG